MTLNYTYAVVDIETTSTHLEYGKIIQFGCVFVRNGEIIDTFSTYVNPQESIEPTIQQLTGISNEMVKDAPTMNELAGKIWKMLSGCVFVAHNILFDYPFVCRRLRECGCGELKLKAIDTVELAQIAFPTLSSYRLQDLSDELGLVHRHPHRADSDAAVTADLLLKIRHRLLQLPMITLKQLAKLGQQLTLNTGWYLYHLIKLKKQQPKDWNNEIQVVSGLALRKIKSAREKYYLEGEPAIHLRPTQQKMVTEIESFLAGPLHSLAIEAPTGTGKTLGYLTAFQSHLSAKQPLVISTSTLMLQKQILDHAIPMLNQMCSVPVKAVLVKSFRHYIDLGRFYTTLNKEESKQARLYQMQLLVWLTQTTTGDLDELNLSTFQHPFWQQIRHRGMDSLSVEQPFYGMDFVRRLFKRVRESEVIVVNHAFLIEEGRLQRGFIPPTPYLVIDEAQQFGRIYQQSAECRISPLRLTAIRKQMDQLDLMKDHDIWGMLKRGLDFYQQALKQFTSDMALRYQPQDTDQQWSEIPCFADLTAPEQETVQELMTIGQDLLQLIHSLNFKKEHWPVEAVPIVREVEAFLQQMHRFLTTKDQTFCREVQGQYQQIWFQVLKGQSSLAEEEWYQNFRKVLFVGATLLVGDKIDYFQREIGLKSLEYTTIPEVFHYEKQGRLFTLMDQNEGENWYDEERTAALLYEIARRTGRKVLCLLTAHSSLEQVYQVLDELTFHEEIEILAQNITGSKAKNFKRFKEKQQAIMLGTDAFWEGIDLPGDSLEILVIAKLPFLAPELNFQKYKEGCLRRQGLNPFYDDALPRAVLRLRQGFGRLIRTETDRGVVVLLDRRFVDSRYSATIQSSIPPQMPLIRTTEEKLPQQVVNFFKTQDKEN